MVPVDGCRIDDEAFAANTGGTMPPPLTSVNGGGGARHARYSADVDDHGVGVPRRCDPRGKTPTKFCIRPNFLWNVQTA